MIYYLYLVGNGTFLLLFFCFNLFGSCINLSEREIRLLSWNKQLIFTPLSLRGSPNLLGIVLLHAFINCLSLYFYVS